METYGRIRAIVLSFYSRDLYRDVAANWRGIGTLYLLLVLAICWLPSAARWFRGLRDFAAGEGAEIARQIPAITIENGIMRVDPAGRHVLRDPDGKGDPDETVVVIDDTIDDVPSEFEDVQAVFLTRREFGMIRPSRGERRVWRLTPGADMQITAARVKGFFDALPLWIPPLGYVLCLAGSLLMRTLQSLVYGAIALWMGQRATIAMDYRAGVRLAAVAMTPVIVARTVIWLTPWEPSWYIGWPIAIAVTVAFLHFGVKAAATPPEA
jgi:hypothetical protein